jgi:hypothetical protein
MMKIKYLGDRATIRLEIVKALVANGKSATEKEVDRLEAIVLLFGDLEKTSRYVALTRFKAPRGKTSSRC